MAIPIPLRIPIAPSTFILAKTIPWRSSPLCLLFPAVTINPGPVPCIVRWSRTTNLSSSTVPFQCQIPSILRLSNGSAATILCSHGSSTLFPPPLRSLWCSWTTPLQLGSIFSSVFLKVMLFAFLS